MGQSPSFNDRAVTVTRRLNWIVLGMALLALSVSLWISAFRFTLGDSILMRYGSIGIGMMLSANAAVSLLPQKNKARIGLWILWAVSVPVAIAYLWAKSTS